jgi:hypothetical protein
MRQEPRRHLALLAFIFALSLLTWSRPASAYGWMIHHGYTGCSTCHADPSGGSLLTAYGRAQSEILLRSHYGGGDGTEEDPGTLGNFALGAIPLPDSLLLGGDYRGAYLWTQVQGTPVTRQFLQMQADLEGQLSIDRFRVNASIGYDKTGAQAAAITTNPQDNLISRVYWAGVDIGEDKQFLLRAGRMNIPYGLRTIEHTMFIHSPPALAGSGVRDDTNQGQEMGVSLAYTGDKLRGEAMAIVGNYQISPDAYRERGYSAYLEWAVYERLAIGVSSLVTHADRDVYYSTPLWRQSHGVFGRWSPWGPLAILGEADGLVDSQPQSSTAIANTHFGYATMVQADLEVWQGLHLMLTGETTVPPQAQSGTSYGGWASGVWFFAPHVDVRIDAIQQSLNIGGQRLGAETLLAQFHAFL